MKTDLISLCSSSICNVARCKLWLPKIKVKTDAHTRRVLRDCIDEEQQLVPIVPIVECGFEHWFDSFDPARDGDMSLGILQICKFEVVEEALEYSLAAF